MAMASKTKCLNAPFSIALWRLVGANSIACGPSACACCSVVAVIVVYVVAVAPRFTCGDALGGGWFGEALSLIKLLLLLLLLRLQPPSPLLLPVDMPPTRLFEWT